MPARDDNFPGYEYFIRISSAASRALRLQGDEMNDAWSQLRDGDYDVTKAMQSWANVVENYFRVFTEVVRGPSELPRPAWLVVNYSKRNPPEAIPPVRIDSVLERATELAYTRFGALGSAVAAEDLYAAAPRGRGPRVTIRLRDDAMQRLQTDSYHVGFIFRKEGSGSPLVIVVLHVTE
jgi:hypothetical protein